MAFTDIRQGAATLVAAKFQAQQGVPVTTWTNDDILRADSAPAPNPNIERANNQGTTGTLYPLNTDVEVARTPDFSPTIKASSTFLRLFLESLLGVTPTETPGSIGTIYTFQGFNTQIPRFLTVVWDDGFEALRVEDGWAHTLNFVSNAREALKLEINGTGREIDFIEAPDPLPLAGRLLTNLHSYAHKDSYLYDEIVATPVPLAAKTFNMQIDHGRAIENANAVAPTFIGKDGRIATTGTITSRLYADTAPLLRRVLDSTRATYRGTWVQDDGKTLEIIIRNVLLDGTFPTVNEDGTMDDLSLAFEPRQEGAAGWPFTIKVEV